MIIFRKCIILILITAIPSVGYANKLDLFKYVRSKAAARAGHVYSPVKINGYVFNTSLDYSAYTFGMHNNPEKDLWGKDGLPFRAELMFPGYKYKKPVIVNEVTGAKIRRLPFSVGYYNFGDLEQLKEEAGSFRDDAGFAGVRFLSKVKTAPWTFASLKVKGPPKGCTSVSQERMIANPGDDKTFLEFVSFVGASYFRAIGKGCDYGLSARGIAINCTVPGKQEEFPDFKEFWLVKPKHRDKSVTLYALLDGPSVAGAYQFIMTPGKITKMKVKSVLYFRKKVDVVGLCPMTSLFAYGENNRKYFASDFRSEVHDSDGLLLYGDKKQIWFPLVNYPNTQMVEKQFHFDKIELFGLLQRDRNYDHYLCIPGCSKNTVPNLWVTPDNNWGSGSVRLTILPTATEWMDNVNVSWKPDIPPAIGKPYYFSYTLNWSMKTPTSKLGFVKSTHVGINPNDPEHPHLIVVSFKGDKLKELSPSSKIKANVSCSNNCSILGVSVVKIPYDKTWQVNMALDPDNTPVDLNCFLTLDGKRLTETWKYIWRPQLQ